MTPRRLTNIITKGTLKVPAINFDSEKGIMMISGRSTPENCDTLYKPLLNWIKAYLKKPQAHTKVTFDYEYFNSSTTKALMRIINRLVILNKSEDFELIINWLYFDEDILEHGEDFEELSGLKFNFIEEDYSNIDFNPENYK